LAEDPRFVFGPDVGTAEAQRLQDKAIDLDEQQLQIPLAQHSEGESCFELSWKELEP
jgi:hypothetical protein